MADHDLIAITLSRRHWDLIRRVLDLCAGASRLWDLGLYEHKDLLTKLAKLIGNKIGRRSNGKAKNLRDDLAHR